MSPSERLLYDWLRKRAKDLQPEVAKRLLNAYTVLAKHLTGPEMVAALKSGQLDALVDQMLPDKVMDEAFAPLRALIDRSVVQAAEASAGRLPPSIQGPAFNTLNPAVIEAALRLDTRVIQDLKENYRHAVRWVATRGIEAGENPRVSAKRMLSYADLGPRQLQAVDRFRLELEIGDRSALTRMLKKNVLRQQNGEVLTRKGHALGAGLLSQDIKALEKKLGTEQLSQKTIDRMVDAYAKRLQALNAEAITRTIAMDSQRTAQRASWEDAIRSGTVDRAQLRRIWVSTHDNRVRPEHAALDGTEVGWDQPYPNGETLPGESTYNCRCIERIVVVHAREAIAA